MYRVSIDTYPNQEVRFTLTKEREKRVPSSPPVPESRSTGTDDPTLDISVKLDNPSKPSERRASRFGTDARRHLLRSGAALDEFDPVPHHKLFITGTLPGSTPQAMKAMADHADFVVHRLKNWLGHRQEERLDFYVWELQKRGALHLHYCAYVPNGKDSDFIERNFHTEWCNLLDAVGKRADCDMYRRGFGDKRQHPKAAVQTRVERVNKSVSAYLSKYVSKESNGISNHNRKYAPKRWWGRSRPLKALTESLSTSVQTTFQRVQDAFTYIRTLTDDLSSMAVKQYSYQHKVGVGETSITYVMRSLWDMARNLVSLKGTGKLTQYGKSKISKSRTILLLSHLTENFSTYSKSSRVGIEPGFMHSMNVCLAMRSQCLDLEFGSVKTWINNLLVLSSKLTCQKMINMDKRLFENPNLHPIQHLWKLRELIWSLDNPTWEDIKLCDLLLDKNGWTLQPGTSTSDEGTGADKGTEPSSPLVGYEQLELV